MPKIIARNDNKLTIQVTMKLTGSLMEMENTILGRWQQFWGNIDQHRMQVCV